MHRNETSKTIPPVIISSNSPTSQLFHVVQHFELRDTNKVLHPDGDILINTRLQTLTDCGLSLVQGVGLGQAGRCHQQCEGFQGEHGGDGDLRWRLREVTDVPPVYLCGLACPRRCRRCDDQTSTEDVCLGSPRLPQLSSRQRAGLSDCDLTD